jgi:hypothetical protein
MREGQIKCKVVSFRIDDDEYSKAEKIAKINGFASVSCFAREATLKCTPAEVVNTPLDVEMNRLWRRIDALASSLENIISHLGAVLNTSGSPTK